MKAEGIRSVAAAALDRWEAVAAAIDPKHQVAGENVVLLNPRRDDRTRNSFSFNRHTGAWKDFAAGPDAAGGDLVSLWAYCRNLGQGPAADDLAAHLALDPAGLPGAPKRKRDDARRTGPVPPEALAAIPGFLGWMKTHRHATGEHWLVRDMEGRALLLRVRCEAPGEKKTVLPYSWSTEKSQWRQGGDFAPLLYGLERLQADPGAAVLLVEGEKTADAAQAQFPHLVALAFMGADTVRKVDVAPLQGRAVILWPDADAPGMEAARALAARISQDGGRARLVDLPDPIKAWVKPGKTEPGGWDLADQAPAGVDLRALLDGATLLELGGGDGQEPAPDPSGLPSRAGCYLIHEGRMSLEDKEGARRGLCNFVARIREELVLDDGEAEDLVFLVEGALAGGAQFPIARVPAGSFNGLGWIMAQWGARAIVNAGTSTKDQLRAAIQHLSRPDRRRAFLCTGWRKMDDRWFYLHAAGALGAEGLRKDADVDLRGRLALFTLADPLQGAALVQAFRSSMRALDLGPGAVTAPVWLSAFRAVVDECPFSIHISGSKGGGKTELASIAAGHFGPALDAKAPLQSWETSITALELTLFYAKDALGLVDDYRPQGGPREVAEATKKADRLLRGAFNRITRDRAASDARTLKGDKLPRGLVMSTGEDLPDGESLRSRVLCLEWAAGDMVWTVLDGLQDDRAAGLHAGLMAAFIQWQAQDRERALRIRREAHSQARRKLRDVGANNRTGDIAADLWSAWPVLEGFAQERGILPAVEIEALGRRLWSSILEMTGAQASIISEANPAERFREGLTSCLASGRGHLASADMGDLPAEWKARCGWQDNLPKGPRLGYLSARKNEVWLIPSAAFQEASRLVAPGVGERALWKRLQEADWLILERAGRNKTRRTMPEGGRPEFVVVRLGSIWNVGQSDSVGQSENPTVPAQSSASITFGPNGTFGTPKTYTPPLVSAVGDDWTDI